jgi:hypothetical protein
MDTQDLKVIVDVHKDYWDRQRRPMQDYTRAYQGRMLADEGYKRTLYNTTVVETPDGYVYVESYMASLFAKGPAVAVSQGPDESGDAHMVESVVNRFLWNQQPTLEQVLRISLLYPFSCLKLGVVKSKNILDQVDMRVIHPWDVIVDMSATRWDLQRYVGHRYYVPMLEASERWGNRKWTAATKYDYIEEATKQPNTPISPASKGQRKESADRYISSDSKQSKALSWVEIWEVYDLQAGQVVWWSPCLKADDGIVDKEKIPFTSADGSPLAPIIPLYLGQDPQYALRGASTLGRVYDQLWEKTNLRTVWANAIRRNARIYFARKGSLDDEAKARIAQNIDQSVIEIDLPLDQAVGTAIVPASDSQLSPDFSIYKAEIQADLDRGNIMAPFTRGVATNTTATEIAALTQYTASEIGRMARQRDTCIEQVADTYARMLVSLLEANPDSKTIVALDGDSSVLTAENMDGDFRYAAADQSSTPLSSAIRRQRFVEVLPTLLQLGVPKQQVLEHLVREYDLPRAFLDAQREEQPKPGDGLTAAPENGTGLPVGGGDLASEMRAAVAPDTTQTAGG